MYAEHTDGTPALREKLMGVELPPVDKPNGSREARVGVENPQRAGVQALRRRHRHAADPQAGDPLHHHPQVADRRSDHRAALDRELRHRCAVQSDRDRSNKSVMTGTTFSRVSYDMPASCSASPARAPSATPRIAPRQEIADNIQTRLASFFTVGSLLVHPERAARSSSRRCAAERGPEHGVVEYGRGTRRMLHRVRNEVTNNGRAARKGHRRVPHQAGSGAPDHPALRSRCRPGARARRRAAGLRGRRSITIRFRWCGWTATSFPPSRRGWSRRR